MIIKNRNQTSILRIVFNPSTIVVLFLIINSVIFSALIHYRVIFYPVQNPTVNKIPNIVISKQTQLNQIRLDLNELKQNKKYQHTPLGYKLNIVNQLGAKFKTKFGTNFHTLQHSLNKILKRNFSMLIDKYDEIRKWKRDNENEMKNNRKIQLRKNKTQITLASISCGDRSKQLMIMLKSAILFSQDAALHSITFVDEDSFDSVAKVLLELKWSAEAKELDFTFEIHMEWFPKTHWKGMFARCATQRLFFPSLLPHIDSLIYLDADTIVISNLTELWLHIPRDMKEMKMASLARNNELTAPGWYDGYQIPHYGPKGLNAGVMLMNLTQMKQFNFEEKSIGVEEIYKHRLFLADQDIINVIFNVFPEKLLVLDCCYNFNWVHCGGRRFQCVNDGSRKNQCFCSSAKRDGVKIVHGNRGTFFSKEIHLSFLSQVYTAFQKLNLLTDSFDGVFKNLRDEFNIIVQPICFPLSADILYKNAETYIQNLNLI